MQKIIFFAIALFFVYPHLNAQNKKQLAVIAYYAGNNPTLVDSVPAEKLTHIIFSFSHLKGNRLSIDNKNDSAVIKKLVALKKRNPELKVMLSLGGWGGCAPCSEIFSTLKNRETFSKSVKELGKYFGTDGLDLDWEYPAIQGYPGHTFKKEDRENFTALVQQLRKTLDKKDLISFAAGGFANFINESIDWEKVMKQVDMVNLMSYDLVNGYSTITGHHTALYSTPSLSESTDNGVNLLLKKGVPANKIVIGAAFYGRMWQDVSDINNGLYQQGKFRSGHAFRDITSQFISDSGFIYHWDPQANAPFLYSPEKKYFLTYDDPHSIELKTRYAIEKGLKGIMFWELTNDSYRGGLLDVIVRTKSQ